MTRLVVVRVVVHGDGPALVAGNQASRDLHLPWSVPFVTMAGFESWFAETTSGGKVAFVAESERMIVGQINLNNISRGSFLSCTVGYHAMAGATGRGLMTEAVRQVLARAFGELGLHRVEANIQPGNAPSLALARRLGFRREGFSPRFLHIAGDWRDHERWALLADEFI